VPAQQSWFNWQQWSSLPSPHGGPYGQQSEASAAAKDEDGQQRPRMQVPSQHAPPQHVRLPMQQEPAQQVPLTPMQDEPSARDTHCPSAQT